MERHPAAGEHLPGFITAPGQTDVLSIIVLVFVIVAVLAVGNLYFRLHALPEQIAHTGNRAQLEIVAILALIALFTHNHLFWIAGLLLAFIRIPDFTTPMTSISRSLAKLAGREDRDPLQPELPLPEAAAPPAGSEPRT
jgi:energy-converting hydrogenase Eha subunit B